MGVFETIQSGEHYDIRKEDYQREVHGEIDRSDHICWQLRMTDPSNKTKLMELENDLFNGTQGEGTSITPPMFIDCGSEVHLGISTGLCMGRSTLISFQTNSELRVSMGNTKLSKRP